MARLQEALRASMQDLENDLVKNPLPPDLEQKLCKAKAEWYKLRQRENDVRLMCPSDPSLRENEELRALYLELSGKVQAALERQQAEEEDRRLRDDRTYRTRLLVEKLKFSHEELERFVSDAKALFEKEVGSDAKAL